MAGWRATTAHGRSGQQISEYAIVIGMAAIAIITIQAMARSAIQRGVQTVSDVVLDRPVSYTVALGDRQGRPVGDCLDRSVPPDGICDCDDQNRDGVCDTLSLRAIQRSEEQGQASFRRETALTDAVTGESEGRFVSTRVIPIKPLRQQPEP